MDHFTHRHFLLALGKPPKGVKGSVFSICADEADARKTMLAYTQMDVSSSEKKVNEARKQCRRQVAALRQQGRDAEVVHVEEALEQEIAEYKEKASASVKRRKEDYERELARMEGPGLTVEEEEWFRELLENLELELLETHGQNLVEDIDEDSEESQTFFSSMEDMFYLMRSNLKSYRRPEQIFDTLRFMDSMNDRLISFTSNADFFEEDFKAELGAKKQRTA
jgi:hypothetical protein